MLRILTDRGTEYCGRADQYDDQLYLVLNDIEHTKTKVRSPQTNGICERFHKTILQEFYQVILRKNIYTDLESLQTDLDEWLTYYNTVRTHQGKMCCGRKITLFIYADLAVVSVKSYILGSFTGVVSESIFRFTRYSYLESSSEDWQVIVGHSSIMA